MPFISLFLWLFLPVLPHKCPQNANSIVNMLTEVESIFLTKPQLTKIIVKRFFRQTYQLCSI